MKIVLSFIPGVVFWSFVLTESCHVCDHSKCVPEKEVRRITKQVNSRIKQINEINKNTIIK
jgi:hypothetical protein